MGKLWTAKYHGCDPPEPHALDQYSVYECDCGRYFQITEDGWERRQWTLITPAFAKEKIEAARLENRLDWKVGDYGEDT